MGGWVIWFGGGKYFQSKDLFFALIPVLFSQSQLVILAESSLVSQKSIVLPLIGKHHES